AGGIIIPDTAQEKPQQGQVIAIGPGGRDESGKLIPIDVKVGNLPPEIQGAKVMSLLFQPSPPLFQPSPPPCASCGITTVIAPAFEKGQRIFAIRCPAHSIIAKPITGPPQLAASSLEKLWLRRWGRIRWSRRRSRNNEFQFLLTSKPLNVQRQEVLMACRPLARTAFGSDETGRIHTMIYWAKRRCDPGGEIPLMK